MYSTVQQYCTVSFGPKNKTKTRETINMLKSRGPLHMPLWPFLAAAALFGTFSGPQHLTQESHPETGRRSARAAMSRPARVLGPRAGPLASAHPSQLSPLLFVQVRERRGRWMLGDVRLWYIRWLLRRWRPRSRVLDVQPRHRLH